MTAPARPFDPHSGSQYVYSQIADISYKRLTRTITVPSGRANCRSGCPTTPRSSGTTSSSRRARPAGTGPPCRRQPAHHPVDGPELPGGLAQLHPHLDHYQTLNADRTCSPPESTPTPGAWSTASGSSGGWQQWSVDLSACRRSGSRSRCAYASDWATQGLEVFIDDIAVSTGEGSTDFEADLERLDRDEAARGSAPTPTTSSTSRARLPPRPPWWPPTTLCTWASASKGSPTPPPGAR